ncbi:hypothetical protein FB45DRAFT_929897 [Roridomyces roridus]|uniref:Protein kinase domain-containing protein n=1 Tax=Roridomyces roridus TaxID=1738132 RepID=A0AAD7BGA6_9AGAR|nr:hypothetical protein FB45DRAFT_929897 [Roridomyces roridus]
MKPAIHGLISDYHPASSLSQTMDSLHPDTEKLVLIPADDETDDAKAHPPVVVSRPQSVPWSVKIAWATDIAASVAWLHSRDTPWGDLKTDNIVLCTDGHCRLIDYYPGGRTLPWCPPKADVQRPQRWHETAEGDVFALGLVLWAVAMEVGDFTREREYVTPVLIWGEGIPLWFQRLAASCVEQGCQSASVCSVCLRKTDG